MASTPSPAEIAAMRETDAMRAITDVIVGALSADDRFAGLELVMEETGKLAIYGVGFGDTELVAGAGVPLSISVSVTE